MRRCSLAALTLIAAVAAGCAGNGGQTNREAVAGADFCPYWSPDGRFVAFERPYRGEDVLQWDVHVVDAAGRSLHRLTRTPDDEGVLGWRRSPQQIMFVRGHHVFALAPIVRAPEQKIGNLPPLNNLVLSPDGASLALTVERPDAVHSDVFVAPVGGGRRTTLPRNYVFGGLPQWSPDGRQLAYADGDETFLVVRRDGRTLARIAGNFPVWSPNSRFIAYRVLDQTNEKAVHVYDVHRRKNSELARTDSDELAWSSDSRAVLYGREGDVWQGRIGGGSRLLFSTRGDRFECLAFSPNGRRIAFIRVTVVGGGVLPPTDDDLVLANANGSDVRTVPLAGPVR